MPRRIFQPLLILMIPALMAVNLRANNLINDLGKYDGDGGETPKESGAGTGGDPVDISTGENLVQE